MSFRALRRPASDYARTEVEAVTEQLINNSPTVQELKDTRDEIKEVALKGLPVPDSLRSLESLDFKDGQQIAEQVVVNLLRANGLPASKEDALRILEKKSYELVQEGLEELSDEIAEACGEYGASAYLTTATEYAGYAGFVVTSAKALEDGKLTQGEIMGMGVSAMSTASSVMAAGAVATGLGVIGAIFAPVAIGVALFEAQNAAQREKKRKIDALAQKVVVEEESQISAFLGGAEYAYRQENRKFWENTDKSILAVADQWADAEKTIGGRNIGLRYFPSSPAPMRAGWQESYYNQELSKYRLRSLACTDPAGCEYFPFNEMYMTRSETEEALRTWYRDTGGKVLGFATATRDTAFYDSRDSRLLVDPEYVAQNIHANELFDRYGKDYAFYWRTIRAFEAFFPYAPGSSNFWKLPGSKDRESFYPFPTYERLALDWDRSGVVGLRRWYAHRIEHYHGDFSGGDNPPRMNARAIDRVQQRFSELQRKNDSLYAIRTRIQGDLVQTSFAVAGERYTLKRFREIAAREGLRLGKDSVAETIRRIGTLKVVDTPVKVSPAAGMNNGVLVAGAALAGSAWWLSKRRKK